MLTLTQITSVTPAQLDANTLRIERALRLVTQRDPQRWTDLSLALNVGMLCDESAQARYEDIYGTPWVAVPPVAEFLSPEVALREILARSLPWAQDLGIEVIYESDSDVKLIDVETGRTYVGGDNTEVTVY